MVARILVLLAVVALAFGAASFRPREGVCPPDSDIEICDASCYVDGHCPSPQKCCRTSCGGAFCSDPVTGPAVLREKPGSCPDPPTGPWICSSTCSVDYDCRGTKKCCPNRCGASACVNPVLSNSLDNNIL